ncbi:MAG: hypothetical protein ACFFDT_24895, partial [Candidatus Hodarchaeota archaeon]
MCKLRFMNLVLATIVFTLVLLNIVMVGGPMVNSPSKVANGFFISLQYDTEEVMTDNQLEVIVGIPLHEKVNVKNNEITLVNLDTTNEVYLSYLFDNSTEALYSGTIPVDITEQNQTTLNVQATVNFNNGSVVGSQFQLPVIFPQLAIECSPSNITVTETESTDLIIGITAMLDGGVEVSYDVEGVNITAVATHQLAKETEVIYSGIIPDNIGIIELSSALGLSPGPWDVIVTAVKLGYITDEVTVNMEVAVGLEIPTGISSYEMDDYGLTLIFNNVIQEFWFDVEQIAVPIQFRNDSKLNPLDYTFVKLTSYGTQSSKRATSSFSSLEISYSIKETRINASDITVYHYSETDNKWNAVTSEVVSEVGGDLIRFTILDENDLGLYGLVETIPEHKIIKEVEEPTEEEEDILGDTKFEFVSIDDILFFTGFLVFVIGILALLIGANKYILVKLPIFKRKPKEILPSEAEEIDINAYILRRRYWTDFLFQGRNIVTFFVIIAILSVGWYIFGAAVSCIEFDGFTPVGLSDEYIADYFDFSDPIEAWGLEALSTSIFLFAHLVMIWVV